MNMNRLKILALAACAAALASSCVRTESSGLNDSNKRYFDAWMKVNHPDAVRAGLGVYIIDDKAGSGATIGDAETYPYALLTYTTADLDGNITETSDIAVARQVGTYKATSYYGPVVKVRTAGSLTAGQEMVLEGMRIGGTRTAAIPGWLSTGYRYDTEQDYIDKVSGEDCIYTVTLNDVIKDLSLWQIDSISRYISHNFPQPVDSLKYGFYYIQTKEPTDTTSFDSGTTVTINYTGKLLDGRVFDTTDEITAKDSGIYSKSKDYAPMSITMNDEYTEINSGSLVDGFAYCLSLMRTGEKGTCIFYSDLGYQAAGSGPVPGYAPLRFDIEMIGK